MDNFRQLSRPAVLTQVLADFSDVFSAQQYDYADCAVDTNEARYAYSMVNNAKSGVPQLQLTLSWYETVERNDWVPTVCFQGEPSTDSDWSDKHFSNDFEEVFSALRERGFYKLEHRLRDLYGFGNNEGPELAPMELASLRSCADFLSKVANSLGTPRIGLGCNGILGCEWIFEKTAVSVDFVIGNEVRYVCISRRVGKNGARACAEGTARPSGALEAIKKFWHEQGR